MIKKLSTGRKGGGVFLIVLDANHYDTWLRKHHLVL
jgi:hypothetical protein